MGKKSDKSHPPSRRLPPDTVDSHPYWGPVSQPKQRKKHAALHRLLSPLTSASASAIVSSHSSHSFSDTADSDLSDASGSDSDSHSTANMLTTHAQLPPISTSPDGPGVARRGPPAPAPPPLVGLDGPSRAQALRSTLSLLRPTTASSTPRPLRPPRPTVVPTSTVASPLTQSPIHAFHAMLETQDQRIRDQWAQQYLNNALAGPAPKGWRMSSITKSPLYNLKDTGGTVPSLKLFALAAYLRRVQQVMHHVSATGPAGAGDWLHKLVPAHVLPLDLRQLVLFHLPFYVTPTDTILALWQATELGGASCALEYVNLSNGRFSAQGLARVLDPIPATHCLRHSADASLDRTFCGCPSVRRDSGIFTANDDALVPDSWDSLSDGCGPDSSSPPLAGPPTPPPLVSLDLSFCTFPQSDLVRVLTSSARAAGLLHLNLSGVVFSLSDAGWSLSCLSNHLLHLVSLEMNYAPWVTKDVLACVDWTCRWRNMRVVAIHKSVVQGVSDVGGIVDWLGQVRPEVRVLVEAP